MRTQGIDFRDRIANLTRPLGFDQNSPAFELEHIENRLILNTYYISTKQIDRLITPLRQFKPVLIWGHPNTLYLMAEYILENDLPPLETKLVATFGEKMHAPMRETLRQVFTGKYVEYYGNRENSIAAFSETDDIFKEVSEYCHLELQDHLQKASIKDHIGAGTLISTSLHNYAFPLIRYETDDIIEFCHNPHDHNQVPLFRIVGGKNRDLLLSKKGLILPFFMTNLEKKGFNKIRQYQIEQTDLDRVVLHVVTSPEYDRHTDEPLLLQYASEALANCFRIELDYCNSITISESGKHRLVVSDLASAYVSRQLKSITARQYQH
jgi:phenylacetate-CoA ligase